MIHISHIIMNIMMKYFFDKVPTKNAKIIYSVSSPTLVTIKYKYDMRELISWWVIWPSAVEFEHIFTILKGSVKSIYIDKEI